MRIRPKLTMSVTLITAIAVSMSAYADKRARAGYLGINDEVYTVNKTQPWAEAVVVHGKASCTTEITRAHGRSSASATLETSYFL